MEKSRFFSAFFAILLFVMSLAGCGKNTSEQTKPTINAETTTKKSISKYSDTIINIALVKNLPGVYNFLELLQDSDNHLNKINFLFAEDLEEACSWLDSGKVDAATLTYTKAISYYNMGLRDTRMFFTASYAPTYIMSKTDKIKSYRDIANKKFYFLGKGSVEEYVCEYGLRDYKREQGRYASSLSDLYKRIESGEVENCVVSSAISPLILKKYPEFNVIMQVTGNTEYTGRVGYDYLYDCLVVTQEFVDKNGDKILDLSSLFKTSSVFTNFQTNEAATLAVKYKIAPSTDIAKDIIVNSKIGYHSNTNRNHYWYNYNNEFYDYYFYGEYPHSDYFTLTTNIGE